MKGASKVIMGATLVMVVSLAIVLGLILVLLAELYCTLLLRRRRQLRLTTTTTATTVSATSNTTSPLQNHCPSPRTTYFAPGVLELESARSLFYPHKENQSSNNVHDHILQELNSSPQHIGLIKASSSPGEIQIQINPNDNKSCSEGEPFVYISNPIYNNDGSKAETPFETPDSSPSRLETGSGGSSGDEEATTATATPPLTPMKKLPAEACSVSLSLRDARSLETSGSESMGNNGVSSSSSSSSGSPRTSPSW